MTELKDIWKTVFPDKPSTVRDAYQEYSKKVLDNDPNMVYTTSNDQDTIRSPEGVKLTEVKQTKQPKVTVEDIVNATGDAYPAYVNELAKLLRDTKVDYSLHASAYMAKLFMAQDALGLTTEEMTAATAAIISQKDVINSSVQKAIDIINKPKVT